MLVTFLKPAGIFLKKLSIFRLQIGIFELIYKPKNGQRILGHDKNREIE